MNHMWHHIHSQLDFFNTDTIHGQNNKYVVIDINRFDEIHTYNNTKTNILYSPQTINIAPYAMHNDTHTGSIHQIDPFQYLAETTQDCQQLLKVQELDQIINFATRYGHMEDTGNTTYIQFLEEVAFGKSLQADNFARIYSWSEDKEDLKFFKDNCLQTIFVETLAKLYWIRDYITHTHYHTNNDTEILTLCKEVHDKMLAKLQNVMKSMMHISAIKGLKLPKEVFLPRTHTTEKYKYKPLCGVIVYLGYYSVVSGFHLLHMALKNIQFSTTFQILELATLSLFLVHSLIA
eukprot:GHVR01014507.1.p1 GENE.GHVR01014507.1~~GHVR01014507.1.p1  ORF type:complete len:307 (-),score=12.37 GHVR01014507.1:334-1206(-)